MKTILVFVPFFICACANLPSKPIQKIEVSSQQDDIRKAMRRYFSLLRDCYIPIFESDSRIQGEMTFSWEIHEGGVARAVQSVATPTSLKNEKLEHCAVGIISRVQFPNPPASTILLVKDYFMRFTGKDRKTMIEVTY